MKSPPFDVQSRLRQLIDPTTQHYLQEYTWTASLTLEIGCGPGQYRLAVNGDYIGVDITASDYKEGVRRTPDVVADAAHLPFRNNMFDAVFFSGVFYHFDNPHSALGEAIRILRPRGHLLMFDYSKKTLERLRVAYAQSSPGVTAHPRACSEWIELLKGVGLVNVHLTRKSLSIKHRLLRWLGCGLLRSIYFSRIDSREGGIVLVGRKQGCWAN